MSGTERTAMIRRDPPRRWPRIKILVGQREMPRETHDRADEIVQAAYREVGYAPDRYWCDERNAWVNQTPVPDWVKYMAAKIAAETLGLPYEIVEWVESNDGSDKNGGTP